jgi:hypothetical protein
MIDRNNLKKGDRILKVSSSYAPRDSQYIRNLVVVSIGSKFIGCQYIDDNNVAYGKVEKYENDERMSLKDWGQWKLFLGTEEEYRQQLELNRKCRAIYNEIHDKLNSNLGYERLSAIKAIMETDDLKKTLAELAEKA